MNRSSAPTVTIHPRITHPVAVKHPRTQGGAPNALPLTALLILAFLLLTGGAMVYELLNTPLAELLSIDLTAPVLEPAHNAARVW